MNIYLSVAALLLAYVAGSLPTAVWAGRIFHGIDIREHGSGNAGATNTIRVLGWKTGIPVLIIDLAKGLLAASLPVLLNSAPEDSTQMMAMKIACGMAAIIGHVFPVLAGFRGGKGVATTFGVLLALHPWLTLTCAGIFLLVLLISGYVSLSSMTAGIMFPILLMTLFSTPSMLFKIFSIVVAIALVLTHTKNIGRLIRGEEKRFIRKKKV
ncbi:MAG: glycerol-3-phosphate 1-O-acyltransferase PlsY [Bacteroidales bacterium]|jgi:glycerol-3-phosphate acyltransferase PlsY|nr:glycerol-3-phosphate 1-O-acyltransferase PlsY [Bacteroidales bacterium]